MMAEEAWYDRMQLWRAKGMNALDILSYFGDVQNHL